MGWDCLQLGEIPQSLFPWQSEWAVSSPALSFSDGERETVSKIFYLMISPCGKWQRLFLFLWEVCSLCFCSSSIHLWALGKHLVKCPADTWPRWSSVCSMAFVFFSVHFTALGGGTTLLRTTWVKEALVCLRMCIWSEIHPVTFTPKNFLRAFLRGPKPWPGSHVFRKDCWRLPGAERKSRASVFNVRSLMVSCLYPLLRLPHLMCSHTWWPCMDFWHELVIPPWVLLSSSIQHTLVKALSGLSSPFIDFDLGCR